MRIFTRITRDAAASAVRDYFSPPIVGLAAAIALLVALLMVGSEPGVRLPPAQPQSPTGVWLVQINVVVITIVTIVTIVMQVSLLVFLFRRRLRRSREGRARIGEHVSERASDRF